MLDFCAPYLNSHNLYSSKNFKFLSSFRASKFIYKPKAKAIYERRSRKVGRNFKRNRQVDGALKKSKRKADRNHRGVCAFVKAVWNSGTLLQKLKNLFLSYLEI